jgi:hypothetical protein
MSKARIVKGRDLIIVDDVPSYRRVTLIRDHSLDQIWIDDTLRSPYQTGAVVAVKISQHFSQHNRAVIDLDGTTGSLRLSECHNHKPGDIIAAVVTSDARDDGLGHKPLQLKEFEDIPLRELPSQTGIITPHPDALMRAQEACPDSDIIHDLDGTFWNEYQLDTQLEEAVQLSLSVPEGGRIAISTPPGAAVIDCDSAESRLSPFDLSQAMVPSIMRQLRLRRIGGPIVIDFPRLDRDEMKKIHNAMCFEAKKDMLKPSLHGFARGGLYTMARPWRDRVLANEVLPRGRMLGLEAFRHIRSHHHHMTAGNLTLRMHNEGVNWLNGAGADLLKDMIAPLAFQVIFVSDDNIESVQRDH